MKKARLHCSHSSHFVKCTCDHERHLHSGRDENEHCTIMRCCCESFVAKPGYMAEQLAHETIPVEGRDYQGQQYGRIKDDR